MATPEQQTQTGREIFPAGPTASEKVAQAEAMVEREAENEREWQEQKQAFRSTLTKTQVDRLVAVDLAWYDETKGELMLDPRDGDFDWPLARTVLGMYEQAVDMITKVDAEQHGTRNRRKDDPSLSESEALADVPRRIAEALSLISYGGTLR